MSDERVSLEDFEGTQPMPASFVSTFGFDEWYWVNNEDGHAEEGCRPNSVDVEDMLNWRQSLMGQEP